MTDKDLEIWIPHANLADLKKEIEDAGGAGYQPTATPIELLPQRIKNVRETFLNGAEPQIEYYRGRLVEALGALNDTINGGDDGKYKTARDRYIDTIKEAIANGAPFAARVVIPNALIERDKSIGFPSLRVEGPTTSIAHQHKAGGQYYYSSSNPSCTNWSFRFNLLERLQKELQKLSNEKLNSEIERFQSEGEHLEKRSTNTDSKENGD